MDKTLEEWASDWADQFDQGWNEESLAEWVGKKVSVRTPEGVDPPKGAVVTVVGYSRDTLLLNNNPVYRFSFLTDEGTQVPLFTAMQVEETEE